MMSGENLAELCVIVTIIWVKKKTIVIILGMFLFEFLILHVVYVERDLAVQIFDVKILGKSMCQRRDVDNPGWSRFL